MVPLTITSVLPRPFYLNYVLVAPNLVQSLLSVCQFTTNFCFIIYLEKTKKRAHSAYLIGWLICSPD
jgi:hypothetical protein